MSVRAPGTSWYNAVWRWHFYAGLFCVPFVLWLSITGTIYLWRPQLEAWLERPYDRLPVAGTPARPEAIVAAALATASGGLRAYQLPDAPGRAARVLVGNRRVYVDPARARVLGSVIDEDRPLRVVFRLHGELLVGNTGSYLVEIAACWAITMLLTGLYLWWPRGRTGLAGVLYPRLGKEGRVFWRDLHAVAGVWVSGAAIVLILTGLPWAKAWGGYLSAVRVATGVTDGPLDWQVGAKKMAMHSEHGGMTMPAAPLRPGELDRVVARVAPMAIAPPVLVAPPRKMGGDWTVTSDAADRPLRTRLTVDGAIGRVTSRRDFAQRHWIDRVVGYGIALHEGALFGLVNQLLGTLVTLLLATLSVSGAVMWWRRRRIGLLGAPLPLRRPRFGAGLIAGVAALGVALPLFGVTLIVTLLVERLLLRRSPAARWLGLA